VRRVPSQENARQERVPRQTSSQRTPPRRRRRRRSRRPQVLFFAGIGFFLLMVLSLILLIHSCVTRNPIVGKWSVDSMTSYVFYEGGKGALMVPKGRYTFDYILEDDQLTIDFHDEKALDSSFTFEKDGDQLTLVGGNKDARGTYVLEKVNK
jgi:hypothetical protein